MTVTFAEKIFPELNLSKRSEPWNHVDWSSNG